MSLTVTCWRSHATTAKSLGSSKLTQTLTNLFLSKAGQSPFPVLCSIQDQTGNLLAHVGLGTVRGFLEREKKYKVETFAITEHTE